MKKILVVSSVYPPEPVISAKVSFDIARKLTESNRVTGNLIHTLHVPWDMSLARLLMKKKLRG